MSYSTIMAEVSPAQSKSASGVLLGAAIGAVVGAVCVTAVAHITPSSVYATTVARPAVISSTTVNVPRIAAQRSFIGEELSAQSEGFQVADVSAQAQGTAVYGYAAALFAAAAAAVSAVFYLKGREVSMAAHTGRREALMTGIAAAGMTAAPAFAAYGDAANVFGKPKEVDQFFEIKGDGWVGKMPGKYNVSREREVAGMVGRWEDNFDAVNAAYVLVRNIGKNSVTELGGLDEVRQSVVTPLLGQQAFDGSSISEGGFAPGRYAAAAILDQKEEVKNGKTYYIYELLTRTADGNEGGRHQLFSIAVSNGKLYVFKTQAGDKRWFKGLERPLRATIDAFTVA